MPDVACTPDTDAHVNAHLSTKVNLCATTCFPARFRALLYPLCVAAGLCYGSTFALVLALAADLFGSEHVATNYGLLDLGESALGGLCCTLRAKGFGPLVNAVSSLGVSLVAVLVES